MFQAFQAWTVHAAHPWESREHWFILRDAVQGSGWSLWETQDTAPRVWGELAESQGSPRWRGHSAAPGADCKQGMESTAEDEEAAQNLHDLIQAFKEHFHSGLWEYSRGKSLSELTSDALGRSMQIPKHCQIAGVGQVMLCSMGLWQEASAQISGYQYNPQHLSLLLMMAPGEAGRILGPCTARLQCCSHSWVDPSLPPLGQEHHPPSSCPVPAQ